MIKEALLAIAVIGGAVLAAAAPASAGDEGRAGGSVADLCAAPWRWNCPLEAFTVDHSPSRVACNGNSAG